VAVQPDGKLVVAGRSRTWPPGEDGYFTVARYNEDGTLDPGFGTDGVAATDLGPTTFDSSEPATAVALQPDGRIVAAGWSRSDFAVVRYLPDGQLDESFGAGGIATVDFGTDDRAWAVAVQPDGKIVVAGQALVLEWATHDFAVARLTADGALDPTFSGDGRMRADVSTANGDDENGDDIAKDLELDQQGRIVVAGSSEGFEGGDRKLGLARLLSSGRRDPSFGGGDGLVFADIGYDTYAESLALDASSNIVIGGHSGTEAIPVAARFGADGSLDRGFGMEGVASFVFGEDQEGRAWDVLRQQDGRIVVAGAVHDPHRGVALAVARLEPNGSADAAFGDGGVGIGEDGSAYAVTLDGSDRIVAAGTTYAEATDTHDVALARFESDGDPDPSLSGDGWLASELGQGRLSAAAEAAAAYPDGRLLLVGDAYVRSSESSRIVLVRYLPDGTRDPSFGDNGVVIDRGPGNEEASTVAIDQGGRIFVGGYASEPPDAAQWLLKRYRPDGSLDPSFGAGGRVVRDGATDHEIIDALVLDADGKIVAAGSLSGSSGWGVARFSADGSPDPTYGGGDGLVTGLPGYVYALDLEADGKLVAAGGSNATSAIDDYEIFVTRLEVDGDLDPSFAANGTRTISATSDDDFANAVSVEAGGRILASGVVGRRGGAIVGLSGGDFGLAALWSDGSPDAALGPGGFVTTDFFGGRDEGVDHLVQPDSSILVAGSAVTGGTQEFALTRYTSTGSTDLGFGADGKATTQFGPGVGGYPAAIVAPSAGRAVIAGSVAIDDVGGAFAASAFDVTQSSPPPPPPNGPGPEVDDPAPGVNGAADDDIAPATAITSARKRVRADGKRASLRIRFESSEPGSTFTCRLDRRRTKPCTSPITVRAKPGKHAFRVRASDAAGNRDPSAALLRFRVLG
jgi:uncharacterized delta-60 repeat protein